MAKLANVSVRLWSLLSYQWKLTFKRFVPKLTIELLDEVVFNEVREKIVTQQLKNTLREKRKVLES